MIKVIIGYKVDSSADMQPVLLKLMSHAMTYHGFISSENLQSKADPLVIATLQTWERLENWRFWETSTLRQSILREAKAFLLEEPRVSIYRVLPTTAWG